MVVTKKAVVSLLLYLFWKMSERLEVYLQLFQERVRRIKRIANRRNMKFCYKIHQEIINIRTVSRLSHKTAAFQHERR